MAHPSMAFPNAKLNDAQAVKNASSPSTAQDPIHAFETLLSDDSISEILVNRPDRIFIERNGQLMEAAFQFRDNEDIEQVAAYLLSRIERPFNHTATIVDETLPDGTRINIVHPPAALEGTSLSIRKFPKKHFTIDNLVAVSHLTKQMASFLQTAVQMRANILISGNTSSGKTTLLNALSAYIAPGERIVTIEDTCELQLQHRNVVRLGTIQTGGEASEINIRALVKNALRMRPDRIIIGEVRGAEAVDLLQAMNTGHAGSMCTIHANNPRDAMIRIEHMIHIANYNLSSRHVREHIPSTFDLIVQTQRDDNGTRRITHITELVGLEGDVLMMQDLFAYQRDIKTGKYSYHFTNAMSRNPRMQKVMQQFVRT